MPSATQPPQEPREPTRLDREIEEILSRSDTIKQLPPRPKPRRTMPKPSTYGRQVMSGMPRPVTAALRAPIFVALALAIVALLVDGVSPLLGYVLSLAAVMSIIVPIVQGWRRPSPTPQSRMWRGRVVDFHSPGGTASPVESLRTWWRSRRR